MLNDPLAATLSKIMNAEKRSKKLVTVKPVSKVIKQVLQIMKDNGYIGEFKENSCILWYLSSIIMPPKYNKN